MRYGLGTALNRGIDGFQHSVDRAREARRQEELDRRAGLRFQREQDLHSVEDQLNAQRLNEGGLRLRGLQRAEQEEIALQPGALEVGLRQQQDDLSRLNEAAGDRELDREQTRTSIAGNRLTNTNRQMSNESQRMLLEQERDEFKFYERTRGLRGKTRETEFAAELDALSDRNQQRAIKSFRTDPTGLTAAEILNKDKTNGVDNAHRMVVREDSDGNEVYAFLDTDGKVISGTDPITNQSRQMIFDKAEMDKLAFTPDDPEYRKLNDGAIFDTKSGQVINSGTGKPFGGALNADQRGTFKIGTNIIAKYYGGDFDSAIPVPIPEENKDNFAQAMAMFERRMNNDFSSPADKAQLVIGEMSQAQSAAEAQPRAAGSLFGNLTGGAIGVSDEEAEAQNSRNVDPRKRLAESYGLGRGAAQSRSAESPAATTVQAIPLARMPANVQRNIDQLTVGQVIRLRDDAGELAGRLFRLTNAGTFEEVPDNGR